MRLLLSLCALAMFADTATAGPVLDRIRANRARCQPAPVASAPAQAYPVPARVPEYLPAPKTYAAPVTLPQVGCAGGNCPASVQPRLRLFRW